MATFSCSCFVSLLCSASLLFILTVPHRRLIELSCVPSKIYIKIWVLAAALQSALTSQLLSCFSARCRTVRRIVTVFSIKHELSWYHTGTLPSKNVTFQFRCRALSSVLHHMHYQHHSGCIAVLLPLKLLASCLSFDLK